MWALAPHWTSDGESGDQLLPDKTLQEEANGLQLLWHIAQAAIGPMTQWGQLWNKHRFQDQHELLSA